MICSKSAFRSSKPSTFLSRAIRSEHGRKEGRPDEEGRKGGREGERERHTDKLNEEVEERKKL
jgi:hypothetical protein